MNQNDTIELTEAETLKMFFIRFNDIDWDRSIEREGKVEDFGLYRLNAANTAFHRFPWTDKLPAVSELAIKGTDSKIQVIHSWDDIRDAADSGLTSLHMNKSVISGFQKALDATKRHTSRVLIAKGLGTPDAVSFRDKNFATVSRTAFDIRQSLFNGTPLDGSAPVAAVAKPTDGIERSIFPSATEQPTI